MSNLTLTIIAVALGALAAGFVQGLSGFAFSMVAMSAWAWALPPQMAAPLAVFGALIGQVSSLTAFRGGFDFSKLWPIVLGGVFGVPLGVFLLHNVNVNDFRLLVGALLIFYSVALLMMRQLPIIRAGGRSADAMVGWIGGVLGGLGGMAGTAPALWTTLRGWKIDARRAAMQVFNITMHLLTLTAYATTGALNLPIFKMLLIVAPATLVGAIFGAHMVRRFNEAAYTRLILATLLVSGVALLYGAGRALMGR